MEKSFIEKYVKIIVVLAVAAGSTSGIFGSVIEAPSMAIGFWRLTLGLPFFAVPVLIKTLKGQESRAEAFSGLGKKEIFWTFVAGAFLFGHFFTWFNAVKNTNIASAVVLAALHPLVVLAVTVFVFKRHVGKRPIVGIILALLGGVMITGIDYRELTEGNFKGDVLAFLAAVFMGLYFAIGAEVRKKVSGQTYVLLVFFACWLCFSIGMLATGTAALGYSRMDYIYIIALTIVCQIGAHAVFNLCFGHVDSLYVSAWESGESAFAIGLGIVFLGQMPKSWQIIGGIIVIIGLLYYNYYAAVEDKNLRRKERESSEL